MQLPKPVFVLGLFPELLEALLDVLAGLSKRDWEIATICAPWSVKEVCLHLLGGDVANLSWKRDGFSVFSEIASYNHLIELVNEQNSRWVNSTRHISSRLLTDMLKFTGEQVNEYFQSLDPFEMGVPVDWVGPGPAPNWLDLAREYTERWHHQQHIRDAVGAPGLKESKFLAPILDTFILGVPRTLQTFKAGDGTSVQVEFTGAVTRNWALIYQGGSWQLFGGILDEPDAGVSIPDDIAWRIFTKGIHPKDARHLIRFSGVQELADRVLETTSIIG